MKKIHITIFFLLAFFTARSQGLTASIDGSFMFPSTLFTLSEAGEDFRSSVVSETPVLVSILSSDYWSKKNKHTNWSIYIYKSDLNWDAGLMLEARRTGAGNNVNNNGNPHINDGDNFQTITNTPAYFFNGRDEIENIPIAINLGGFSIIMGAKDFETNIVLTVYED